MELANLPTATARLAVELQLADIMQDMDAGDAYAAFDAMQASLKAALLMLQDQSCAIDILQGDLEDRVVFQNLMKEERQAERDHEIARGINDVMNGGRPPSTGRTEERFGGQESWLGDDFGGIHGELGGCSINGSTVRTMEDTYCGHDVQRIPKISKDPAASYAEPSTRPLGKGKGKARDSATEDEHMTHTFCSACMEQCTRFDVLELGCKREGDDTYHAYCRSCLVDLFQTSLTDTTLFPPRCCGKYIPISACVDLLSPELVRQYKDKQVELESPNPVYCSNRYCGKSIKSGTITADIATCQSCHTETCAVCKNPKHNGLCPKDPTVQLLMDVAGKKRWQRCPRCRTMVELNTGCNHMRPTEVPCETEMIARLTKLQVSLQPGILLSLCSGLEDLLVCVLGCGSYYG